MKVLFDTLGCKLNQAETDLLAGQFAEAGHELVSKLDEADVYILNTCTVTHIADAKSRHLLRLAHRRNPDAVIVAMGCYAQRVSQELTEINGVNLVVGNGEKFHLLRLLQEMGYITDTNSTGDGPITNYSSLRTRAFIKIQDGCNKFCSYCIVPLVRGREKSIPVENILTEINHRVSGGCKEVVLTGTEIGSYNYENIDLKALLKLILVETDVTRLRLSSLQPQEIVPELIDLWSDNRLCPHFHLSLQSGSDEVLKRMNRHYSVHDYQQAVSLIINQLPETAITTDIIVGFPGETEAEFEESYRLCQQLGFARIHVFSYSARDGTKAAGFSSQVNNKLKKQRSQLMLTLAKETSCRFRQQFLGKIMPVLWEKQVDGTWSGFTGNYIKIYTGTNDNLTNKLTPVKLMRIRDGELWGKCLAPQTSQSVFEGYPSIS
ncbi:tRNA (N(6)-L-threonylcarbamoyladenosine(37)-C(2))-methylthiotransferase MtaB [Chloroflexota bacterium]